MADPLTVTAAGLTLAIDAETLTAIVREVVRETLTEIGTDDRLAYSEAEAADLLGVKRHTLRDARLRGEVHGVRVGKEIRYSRAELVKMLDREGR